MRLRGLSPKTVESYLGRLKLFLKYFNNRPIEEMNEIEIREYGYLRFNPANACTIPRVVRKEI